MAQAVVSEDLALEDQELFRPWTQSLHAAVREFVEGVSDSSRQIAAAAEQLATKSLRVMDYETALAEASADTSAAMANAAREAAAAADSAQQAARSAAEAALRALAAAGAGAGDSVLPTTARGAGETPDGAPDLDADLLAQRRDGQLLLSSLVKELLDRASSLAEIAAAQLASAPRSPAGTLYGRVRVTVSPVLDFDRLRRLGSALDSIEGLVAVNLPEYTGDVVTFHVDISRPLAASELTERLGQATGIDTHVAVSSASAISLRLG